MELSGGECVCPCTCLAVCVPQHVPLYTVHMYSVRSMQHCTLVDVYESVITNVGTSLYARFRECFAGGGLSGIWRPKMEAVRVVL